MKKTLKKMQMLLLLMILLGNYSPSITILAEELNTPVTETAVSENYANIITAWSVAKRPKDTYQINETLDLSGLYIQLTYQSGETNVIPYEELTSIYGVISNQNQIDLSVEGKKNLILSKEGLADLSIELTVLSKDQLSENSSDSSENYQAKNLNDQIKTIQLSLHTAEKLSDFDNARKKERKLSVELQTKFKLGNAVKKGDFFDIALPLQTGPLENTTPLQVGNQVIAETAYHADTHSIRITFTEVAEELSGDEVIKYRQPLNVNMDTLNQAGIHDFQTSIGDQKVSTFFYINMEEQKSNFTITKMDQTGTPIPNVVFELKDLEENIVSEVTSDTNGQIVFENLDAGTYTMVEKSAPEGFEKATETWTVVVTKDGEVIVTSQSKGKNLKAELSDFQHYFDVSTKKLSFDTTVLIPKDAKAGDVLEIVSDSRLDITKAQIEPLKNESGQLIAYPVTESSKNSIQFVLTELAESDKVESTKLTISNVLLTTAGQLKAGEQELAFSIFGEEIKIPITIPELVNKEILSLGVSESDAQNQTVTLLGLINGKREAVTEERTIILSGKNNSEILNSFNTDVTVYRVALDKLTGKENFEDISEIDESTLKDVTEDVSIIFNQVDHAQLEVSFAEGQLAQQSYIIVVKTKALNADNFYSLKEKESSAQSEVQVNLDESPIRKTSVVDVNKKIVEVVEDKDESEGSDTETSADEASESLPTDTEGDYVVFYAEETLSPFARPSFSASSSDNNGPAFFEEGIFPSVLNAFRAAGVIESNYGVDRVDLYDFHTISRDPDLGRNPNPLLDYTFETIMKLDWRIPKEAKAGDTFTLDIPEEIYLNVSQTDEQKFGTIRIKGLEKDAINIYYNNNQFKFVVTPEGAAAANASDYGLSGVVQIGEEWDRVSDHIKGYDDLTPAPGNVGFYHGIKPSWNEWFNQSGTSNITKTLSYTSRYNGGEAVVLTDSATAYKSNLLTKLTRYIWDVDEYITHENGAYYLNNTTLINLQGGLRQNANGIFEIIYQGDTKNPMTSRNILDYIDIFETESVDGNGGYDEKSLRPITNLGTVTSLGNTYSIVKNSNYKYTLRVRTDDGDVPTIIIKYKLPIVGIPTTDTIYEFTHDIKGSNLEGTDPLTGVVSDLSYGFGLITDYQISPGGGFVTQSSRDFTNLIIVKVTENGERISNNHAQFALYNEKTNTLLGNYENNDDATLLFKNLTPGSYYFIETQAPDGFKIEQDDSGSAKKYRFTVNTDLSITYEGKNLDQNLGYIAVKNPSIASGKLVIKKVDEDNKTKALPGAYFKLVHDKTLKTTILGPTDSEGLIKVDNLEEGTYTLQEYTAPDGYVISDKKQTFYIDRLGRMLKDYDSRNAGILESAVMPRSASDANTILTSASSELPSNAIENNEGADEASEEGLLERAVSALRSALFFSELSPSNYLTDEIQNGSIKLSTQTPLVNQQGRTFSQTVYINPDGEKPNSPITFYFYDNFIRNVSGISNFQTYGVSGAIIDENTDIKVYRVPSSVTLPRNFDISTVTEKEEVTDLRPTIVDGVVQLNLGNRMSDGSKYIAVINGKTDSAMTPIRTSARIMNARLDSAFIVQQSDRSTETTDMYVTKIDQAYLPLSGAHFRVVGDFNNYDQTVETKPMGNISGLPGDNYVATFSGLKQGTYTIQEVRTPEGYQDSGETWRVSVQPDETVNGKLRIRLIDAGPSQLASEAKTHEIVIVNKIEPKSSFSFKLHLVDEQGDPVLNGEFSFISPDGNEVSVEKNYNHFTYELSQEGVYTLKQTATNTGYTMDSSTRQFRLEMDPTTGEFTFMEIGETAASISEKTIVNTAPANKPAEPEIVLPPEWTDNPVNNQTEDDYTFVISNKKETPVGEMTVTKYGRSATEEKLLQGVVFSLTPIVNDSEESSKTVRYTTDANGKITMSNLAPGQYRLKEESAIDGYTPTKETWLVTVSPDGETSYYSETYGSSANALNPATRPLTVVNFKDSDGNLVLTKVDEENGDPLADATFVLKDTSGAVVKTGTSNQEGKIVFKEIPAGAYTLEEQMPPTGYQKTAKKWDVIVEPDGTTIVTESEETRNAATSGGSLLFESRHAFENLTPFVSPYVFDADTFRSNALSDTPLFGEEAVAVSEEELHFSELLQTSGSATGQARLTLPTNRVGQTAGFTATMQAPVINETAGTFSQTITFNTTMTRTISTSSTRYYNFNFSTTNGVVTNVTGLPSIFTNVRQSESGTNSYRITTVPTTRLPATFTITVNGRVNNNATGRLVNTLNTIGYANTSSDHLFFGSNSEATNGNLSVTTWSDIPKSYDPINLTVKNVDEFGTAVTGSTLRLYKANGTQVALTDIDEPGIYTLKQTGLNSRFEIPNPSEWSIEVYNDNGQLKTRLSGTPNADNFTLDSTTNTLTVTNYYKPYTYTIATIALDGVDTSGVNYTITSTTNPSNTHTGTTFNLSEGTYMVTANNVPSGYVANPSSWTLTVNQDNLGTGGETSVAVTMLPPAETVALRLLTKGSEVGDILIPTATYNVSEIGSVQNGDTFSLRQGRYTITQLTTDDSHILPTEPIVVEVTLDEGNTNNPQPLKVTKISGRDDVIVSGENGVYTLQVINNATASLTVTNKVTDLRITKVGAKDTILLDGAEFSLYNEDESKVLATEVSKNGGELHFTKLVPGNYVIKEAQAPTGYELTNHKWKISVDDTGSITAIKVDGLKETIEKIDDALGLKITNEVKKGKVTITKVSNQNERLINAVFGIYEKDGNTPIMKGDSPWLVTSNSEGIAVFEGLEAGSYVIKEVQAPQGYDATDQTWPIVVDENGNVSTTTTTTTVGTYTEIVGAQFNKTSNGVSTLGSRIVDVDTENKTYTQLIYFNRWTDSSSGRISFDYPAYNPRVFIYPYGYDTSYGVPNNKVGGAYSAGTGITSVEVYKTVSNTESAIKTYMPNNFEIDLSSRNYQNITNNVIKGTLSGNGVSLSLGTNLYYGEGAIIKVTGTYSSTGDKPILANVLSAYNNAYVDRRDYYAYTYNEVQPKAGETTTIEQGGDNNLEITAVNTRNDQPLPNEGKLEITKIDEENSSLPNAQFGLYSGLFSDLNGTEPPLYTGYTNSSGYLAFDKLTPGTYTLKEIAAPSGYTLTDTTWTVIVHDTGMTTIKQNPSDPKPDRPPKDVSSLMRISNMKLDINQNRNMAPRVAAKAIYINKAESLQFSFDFAFLRNADVKAGDTFDVVLDEKIYAPNISSIADYSEGDTIDIKLADGTILATATYPADGDDNKIRFTFTKDFEGYDINTVKGSYSIPVGIDRNKITGIPSGSRSYVPNDETTTGPFNFTNKVANVSDTFTGYYVDTRVLNGGQPTQWYGNINGYTATSAITELDKVNKVVEYTFYVNINKASYGSGRAYNVSVTDNGTTGGTLYFRNADVKVYKVASSALLAPSMGIDTTPKTLQNKAVTKDGTGISLSLSSSELSGNSYIVVARVPYTGSNLTIGLKGSFAGQVNMTNWTNTVSSESEADAGINTAKVRIVNKKEDGMDLAIKKLGESNQLITKGDIQFKLAKANPTDADTAAVQSADELLNFNLSSQEADGHLITKLPRYLHGRYVLTEEVAPTGYIRTGNKYLITIDKESRKITLTGITNSNGRTVAKNVVLYSETKSPTDSTQVIGNTIDLEIVNKKPVYPDTGGFGSQNWYYVGISIMLGALVIFIFRRRKAEDY
ncbi:SpaA isopeptide-forming pilin-related protein [Streptococcus moroccensis]|uniref:LPXTG-motif cell wall-anchored protein n=1 Tax=Streptococcus moroccensis TaxID=1451356 RepID=A0ABT9YV02_9STRE|nr:SpaA isopeptide-forming pilin-related protein [Streptococcus moroccensis]MDQ0223432.1 LPXTG-motif cell wall-anchored protein [Streptococcus moroccensis]